MEQDLFDPVSEITKDLRRLTQPLRDKHWAPILEYLAGARIVIKGVSRDPVYLRKFLAMRTAAIRNLEVVMESLLESHIQPERIEWKVRVAAVGSRIEENTPDGIIMDVRLVFLRAAGRWQPGEVVVDCPPDWAQWNSRPNSRAPIHYGDPEWWERRTSSS